MNEPKIRHNKPFPNGEDIDFEMLSWRDALKVIKMANPGVKEVEIVDHIRQVVQFSHEDPEFWDFFNTELHKHKPKGYQLHIFAHSFAHNHTLGYGIKRAEQALKLIEAQSKHHILVKSRGSSLYLSYIKKGGL